MNFAHIANMGWSVKVDQLWVKLLSRKYLKGRFFLAGVGKRSLLENGKCECFRHLEHPLGLHLEGFKLTTAHRGYDSYSTSISVYGMWEVMAGNQASKRELYTHIHLD